MLPVDPAMSDEELCTIVTTMCKEVGAVKSVKIHRRPKLFALVEMTTDSELLKLAGRFGRAPIGRAVLLHLASRKKDYRP